MADQASQPIDPANGANGTSAAVADGDRAEAVTTPEATAPTAAASASIIEPTDGDLLSELARAMHLAATAQYERMNAELERRRTEQVDAIAARAGSEAEQLKAGSEADISAIDAWAKAESEKIKLERLRRIDARREQLSAQLERQATTREREILAIEAAIDAHRTEIDQFFGRMERETDPAAIARVASTLPVFPSLAEIGERARGGSAAEFAALETAAEALASEPAGASVATDPEATISESRLMAVMDPDATHPDAEGSRPWEAPYAVSVAAGSIPAGAPAGPEAPSRVGSTLLRTVRAIRPMSGDRHDRSGDER